MKCPVCEVQLSISSREGVEIDFCPQCRGVWLDRGELDKVIERAAASLAPTAPVGGGAPRYEERREPRYDDRTATTTTSAASTTASPASASAARSSTTSSTSTERAEPG